MSAKPVVFNQHGTQFFYYSRKSIISIGAGIKEGYPLLEDVIEDIAKTDKNVEE